MVDSEPFKQLILLKIIVWYGWLAGWRMVRCVVRLLATYYYGVGVRVLHCLIIFADALFPLLICFLVCMRSAFLASNECYSKRSNEKLADGERLFATRTRHYMKQKPTSSQIKGFPRQ